MINLFFIKRGGVLPLILLFVLVITLSVGFASAAFSYNGDIRIQRPAVSGITYSNVTYTNVTYTNITGGSYNETYETTTNEWNGNVSTLNDLLSMGLVWNYSNGRIFQNNLSAHVGIGTNNPDLSDLFIQSDDDDNTYVSLSSGAANGNATIMWKEFGVLKAWLYYNSKLGTFNFWSSNFEKDILTIYTNSLGGLVKITSNLSVSEQVWAANLCYANATNCNLTAGSTFNATYDVGTNSSFNQTLTDSLYGLGGNATFNQSLTDAAYAGIQWGYNQTYSGSTYNSSYIPWTTSGIVDNGALGLNISRDVNFNNITVWNDTISEGILTIGPVDYLGDGSVFYEMLGFNYPLNATNWALWGVGNAMIINVPDSAGAINLAYGGGLADIASFSGGGSSISTSLEVMENLIGDKNITASGASGYFVGKGKYLTGIPIYNSTYNSLINNASYLSTYNSSYLRKTGDAMTGDLNLTATVSLVGNYLLRWLDNAGAVVEAYIYELNGNLDFYVASGIFNFNSNVTVDGLVNATAVCLDTGECLGAIYNSTYNGLVNNASYLSTYNSSYANGVRQIYKLEADVSTTNFTVYNQVEFFPPIILWANTNYSWGCYLWANASSTLVGVQYNVTFPLNPNLNIISFNTRTGPTFSLFTDCYNPWPGTCVAVPLSSSANITKNEIDGRIQVADNTGYIAIWFKAEAAGTVYVKQGSYCWTAIEP